MMYELPPLSQGTPEQQIADLRNYLVRLARDLDRVGNGEVTISEWAATKRKIEKAMVDPSSDQMDVFRMLGLTGMGGKGGNTEILNI